MKKKITYYVIGTHMGTLAYSVGEKSKTGLRL
jgi:hypothetical protein